MPRMRKMRVKRFMYFSLLIFVLITGFVGVRHMSGIDNKIGRQPKVINTIIENAAELPDLYSGPYMDIHSRLSLDKTGRSLIDEWRTTVVTADELGNPLIHSALGLEHIPEMKPKEGSTATITNRYNYSLSVHTYGSSIIPNMTYLKYEPSHPQRILFLLHGHDLFSDSFKDLFLNGHYLNDSLIIIPYLHSLYPPFDRNFSRYAYGYNITSMGVRIEVLRGLITMVKSEEPAMESGVMCHSGGCTTAAYLALTADVADWYVIDHFVVEFPPEGAHCETIPTLYPYEDMIWDRLQERDDILTIAYASHEKNADLIKRFIGSQ